MAEIIGIRFKREGKQYYFDPQGMQVQPGMGVILETSWGIEFGECVRGNSEVPDEELVAPLRPILRLATKEDYEIVRRNREREKDAFSICQQKIAEHGLDMKLVDVEFGFEGNKILFFFTSEGRVDFRALVKDLAAIFHSRIELRQIGVRDEAKMLGGLGICGRPFCCSSFLRDFQPVSIKMAKTQSLSLNPTKISGTCGRLMCCLKYEQEAYEDLLKNSPKAESFVETPDGVGDIISVNTLREKVRVRLDNAPDTLKVYHSSEIRVIRSGKGKRPEEYRVPSPKELEKLRRVQNEVLQDVKKPESALQNPLSKVAAQAQVPHHPKPQAKREEHPVHGESKEDRPSSNRNAGNRGNRSGPPQKHPPKQKEPKPELMNHPAPKKAMEPVEKPQLEQKKVRRNQRTASQAAMEKALPREKQAQQPPKEVKEPTEGKKARRPYWRKKPGNPKPKKKDAE